MTYVGIDLGTTYSVVAHLDASGVAVSTPNSEGDLTTPSVVLYESEDEIIVGREAKLAASAVPDRVAQCTKRYMGDPHYPDPLAGKMRSPVEISAQIVKKLKEDADKHVGDILGAVITVPAYFDEGRRHATAEAGRLAGLKVLDIINEPTAAALAYAYQQFVSDGGDKKDRDAMLSAVSASRTVLVYDLGGGTFDVTLLRIDGTHFKVLSTDGDVRLGGRDWDEVLVTHLAETFLAEKGDAPGNDPRENPLSYQSLLKTAEEVKRNLTSRTRTHFVVNHAGHAVTGTLTRDAFERLTKPLLYRTERRVNRVVNRAGLSWGQVDDVVTVGGSTRMPQVLAMLESITGRPANTSMSPDESVARGAAIHAAARVAGAAAANENLVNDNRESRKLKAPNPKNPIAKTGSEDVEIIDGPEAPIGDIQPSIATGGEQKSMRNDVESGEVNMADYMNFMQQFTPGQTDVLERIKVTDVNSHSFGVIIRNPEGNRTVSILIPRNTSLPAIATKKYGTVSQGQKSVSIRVVEGESEDVSHCIPIGVCRLKLPPNLPAKSPIEVAFNYDDGGRLHVRGKSLKSPAWTSVVIERGVE